MPRNFSYLSSAASDGARKFFPGGLSPPKPSFSTYTKYYFTQFKNFSGWAQWPWGWAELTPGAATACWWGSFLRGRTWWLLGFATVIASKKIWWVRLSSRFSFSSLNIRWRWLSCTDKRRIVYDVENWSRTPYIRGRRDFSNTSNDKETTTRLEKVLSIESEAIVFSMYKFQMIFFSFMSIMKLKKQPSNSR